jgi:hypothetical protein
MSRSAISEKTSTQITDLSDGPAPGAEAPTNRVDEWRACSPESFAGGSEPFEGSEESQVEFSAEWVLGDSVEDARFPTGIPG